VSGLSEIAHVYRWDLDKTYLRTDFDTWRGLLRAAWEKASAKVNVAGSAALMRELKALPGARVCLISGSPRQMRKTLEEKFRLDRVGVDEFTLKPNVENLLRGRFRALRDQVGYKLPALLQSRMKLAKELEETLLTPGKTEPVKVKTTVVKPKVSTEQLAEKYPAVLIVNRSTFKLQLDKNLKLKKTYGIAVGQVGLDTPAGLYNIQNKAVNPAWHVPNSDWAGDLAGTVVPPGPDNPIKARWMGIADGVGVHGTSDRGSIGSNASHGCVRMLEEDVIALYDEVPVGAPIYIS